ncbi:glycoside hydrolase family 16 protein, partial [bacterium]|nr:glycoside hydrolase family 16 protein [bacterium]
MTRSIFVAVLWGLMALGWAIPEEAQQIVEDFVGGDPSVQLIDDSGAGNEATWVMPRSGFRWGGYDVYTGPQTNRGIGVGARTGASDLVFYYTTTAAGSYAYTVFSQAGTGESNMYVDLSTPESFIEHVVTKSDVDPSTLTAIRHMIRVREGEARSWYVSDPVTWGPVDGFTTTSFVSGLSWYAVDLADSANLNLLAGGDEGAIAFALVESAPDLAMVDGGGIYVDFARDNWEAMFSIERITWASRGNLPAGTSWQLVYEDEFDGTSLDWSEWGVENSSPSHIDSSRWVENIEVHDGVLHLVSHKEQRGGKEWTTGHVWTRAFRKQEGFFEASCRYAPGTGLNNAWWLFEPGYFEFDINEGHYPDEINMNYHWWEGAHQSWGSSV